MRPYYHGKSKKWFRRRNKEFKKKQLSMRYIDWMRHIFPDKVFVPRNQFMFDVYPKNYKPKPAELELELEMKMKWHDGSEVKL